MTGAEHWLEDHDDSDYLEDTMTPLELELNLFSKLTNHHRDMQEDNPYNPDVHFSHWAGLAKHVYNYIKPP